MKRAGVSFVLLALLTVPIAVAAQYDEDHPMGGDSGNHGGGISIGGGMDDGGIMVGGGDMHSDDMMPGSSEDVAIVDFSFQPSSNFVHVGDTVEWTNTGAVAHTVDADSESFESGTINPGGGFSATFDEHGVFAYHCDFHPNMRGTIVVN